MKIGVCGGAGYIGSHTVLELLKAGHDVFVIDNLSTGSKEFLFEEARFYEADCTSETELNNVFEYESKSGNIDAIMHFAAKLIVNESVSMPLDYYYNNVFGVITLIQAMRKADIRTLIFSSTAAVYGDHQTGFCKEGDLCQPINPYGNSKLAAEMVIQDSAKAYGLNTCIFRYFNVAGAHPSLRLGLDKSTLTHIVPITVMAALKQRSHVTIFGDDYPTDDGTCIRDYIHVSDLAYAHVLGLEYTHTHQSNEIFNLGSSQGYSVKQVIDAVQKIAPCEVQIGERREGDPAKLIAVAKKANEVLQWNPQYSLSDIVKTDYDFRLKRLNNEVDNRNKVSD
jgi:UDP-glucose 4-epimerase